LEISLIIPEDQTNTYVDILKLAIKRTNEKLKLNVYIDIDIQVGKNYKEVH